MIVDEGAVALIDAYDHIVTHPEDWDQSTWHAGNGRGCLAYHIARQAGARSIDPHRPGDSYMWWQGGQKTVRQIASEVLGVPADTTLRLFHRMNTLDDLAEIIAELTGSEVEDIVDVPALV